MTHEKDNYSKKIHLKKNHWCKFQTSEPFVTQQKKNYKELQKAILKLKKVNKTESLNEIVG